MRPTILIFGANGFIGGSLSEYLRDKGHKISMPSSLECNLLNTESLFRHLSSLTNPVQIVFCAGITPQRDHSFQVMLKNIQMIHSLGEVISHFSIQSIIYLSSVDVYGFPSETITENSPLCPRGYHGLAKVASEMMLDITPSFTMPVTILRLPGVYGLGDRQKSIVGSFVNQLSNNKPVTIYGDGSTLRDYVQVNDVCRLIEGFFHVPYRGRINVATGQVISIKDLVILIGKALGVSPQIHFQMDRDVSFPKNLVFDISRLKKIAPEFQFTDIDEGITNYVHCMSKK